MNLDFTLVDVLVVVTVILSAVLAAYRGFVNESLSIVAWAAAAFATLYFAPAVVPFVRAHMSAPLVGTIVAYVGIFVAVLLPLSFMTHRFSQSVQNSPVGVIDGVLGAIFGVIRGFAVLGIAYIVFSLFVPVHSHPRWLREASLLPLIRDLSPILLSLVHDQHLGRDPGLYGDDPIPEPRQVDRDNRAKHHKKYGAQDRRELDHLIETTGSGGGQ